MSRAGLCLISEHLSETGNAFPETLFVLLHTPAAQKLSEGSNETIGAILANKALHTDFMASLRAERHQSWRRLIRATARGDWSLWLKDYWASVAPASELVTTLKAADELRDRKQVGLRATRAPLLYGATRLFREARDIGIEHEAHVILSARDLEGAAEVAARAARRESVVPTEELKRLRPAARPPRPLDDDYWGAQDGMWWLGGS